MEILKKYKKQEVILETSIYKDYLNKLSLYYNEDTDDKYEKEQDETYYKLIDKKNEANIITIYKIKVIDLHIYYDEINNKINNIYRNISELITSLKEKEHEEEFEKLKEEYTKLIKDKNDIMEIFKIQNKNILKLQEEKINLIIQLYKIYMERKNNYKKVKPVNKEMKSKIINLYKSKYKLLSDNEYTHYSKKLNLPFNELKMWCRWLESCYIYIQLQIKINKIITLIEIEENKNDKINHTYIINEPKIKEDKIVTINKE